MLATAQEMQGFEASKTLGSAPRHRTVSTGNVQGSKEDREGGPSLLCCDPNPPLLCTSAMQSKTQGLCLDFQSQSLQYSSALGGTPICPPIFWCALGYAGVPVLVSSGRGVFSELLGDGWGTREGQWVVSQHVARQMVPCTTPADTFPSFCLCPEQPPGLPP